MSFVRLNVRVLLRCVGESAAFKSKILLNRGTASKKSVVFKNGLVFLTKVLLFSDDIDKADTNGRKVRDDEIEIMRQTINTTDVESILLMLMGTTIIAE